MYYCSSSLFWSLHPRTVRISSLLLGTLAHETFSTHIPLPLRDMKHISPQNILGHFGSGDFAWSKLLQDYLYAELTGTGFPEPLLCISPNPVFMLVAWIRPTWEYLHHEIGKHNKPSYLPPRESVVKHLP